ncbi:MAG: glycosyltransferase family 39 protein [Proteobacteria bacterium]|nr:glycosyltransferase family 39 protein [Pseudomonadota bacterium]
MPAGLGSRPEVVARLALVLIVFIACLASSGSWRIYSATWDEPEHLAAGIQLLDEGLYEYDTEHPPLARLFLAAGPYLAGARSYGTPPPDGTQEGKDILYGGDYEEYLMLARAGTLPFLALLLFSTWLWAQRLMPTRGAALTAVALVAGLPAILGHAALATLDIAATATMLLALYAMQQWLATARLRDALAFGLATGVAVATKFSAIPFLGLSLPAVVAMDWVNQRREQAARGAPGFASTHLPGLLMAVSAGIVLVLLVYTPRAPDAGGVEVRWDWAVDYLLQLRGWEHTLGVWFSHATWLPREFKDFLNGVIAVKAHNDAGHRSYLFGQMSPDGWWYFYLVALAVKTPIPLLVAAPFGLWGLARAGWRNRDGWAQAPLVLVTTILVFASTFSRINIGIRHVLILYPFLALCASYALWQAWQAARRLPQRRLAFAATAAIAAAVLWQFSVLWRAYPDYLPYFNETVRHPERVLVDSDLDWGQDLGRLEDRIAGLKVPELTLAYLGTVDFSREPLPPFRLLKLRQPVHGWVAISALARVSNPPGYAWLDAYQPLERVGKTIDLYYIP